MTTALLVAILAGVLFADYLLFLSAWRHRQATASRRRAFAAGEPLWRPTPAPQPGDTTVSFTTPRAASE